VPPLWWLAWCATYLNSTTHTTRPTHQKDQIQRMSIHSQTNPYHPHQSHTPVPPSRSGTYRPPPGAPPPHGGGQGGQGGYAGFTNPAAAYGPPPGADPQLWQWFRAVDEDRSGSISCQELQRALVNGNWARAFYPLQSTINTHALTYYSPHSLRPRYCQAADGALRAFRVAARAGIPRLTYIWFSGYGSQWYHHIQRVRGSLEVYC